MGFQAFPIMICVGTSTYGKHIRSHLGLHDGPYAPAALSPVPGRQPRPPFGPIEAQTQQLPATLFKNIISPIGLM